MKTVLLWLFILSSSLTSLLAQNPNSTRPAVVDLGNISLTGTLMQDHLGNLSEFQVLGMDFVRDLEGFDTKVVDGYRVIAVSVDGSISEAPLDVMRLTAGPRFPEVGQQESRGWFATFNSTKNIKEISIYFYNQLLFQKPAPVNSFQPEPSLTQIDRYQIKIEPMDVNNLECTFDGGMSLVVFERSCDFPNGVLTIDQKWCKPGFAPLLMLDVIQGWSRHTAWLVLDPNYVSPKSMQNN